MALARKPVRKELPNCLICMGGEVTEEISAVSSSSPFALECNIDYFAELMEQLEKTLPNFHSYTFAFTRNVTELPKSLAHKSNLVVFIMGDEWARVPSYAASVHAVFKAPGQHMKLATHNKWLRFNLMTAVQYVRQLWKRFPHHHRDTGNIFAIPYGYYRLPRRTEVTPINKRSLDVSFTGSIDHKKALKGLVKTSKVLSRERMVETVDRWKQDKDYSVDVKLSSFFPKANDKPEHDDYPRILMDTRICLSPRGTHLETYRLCEGMYYGCVVIAEEQPDHWFAEDSPAIIIRDWKKLPALLDELLENPSRLEALQKASLDYWDNTLSPQSVASYLQQSLNSLPSGLAANDETNTEEKESQRLAS